MNKYLLSILVIILLFSTNVAAESFGNSNNTRTQNKPEKKNLLLLSCTIRSSYSGTSGDTLYLVDFDSKTVNGDPVNITESSISWRDSTVSVSINRFTGTIRGTNNEYSDITYNGKCVKAPDRQF